MKKKETYPTLDAKGRPLPETACPNCGYNMDAATSCDENDPAQLFRPKPGDLSVCLKCATVLQFAEDMTVQAADLDAIDADDDTKFQVRRIQQKIRMMKRP